MNKKMKSLWAAAVLLAAGALPLAASTEELHVIRFPERRDVEVEMQRSPRIPNAEMKAKVKFEEGQARIEIEYDNMKPAVLFAGDVTCYVLWAINRDGAAENLGELWVRPEKDEDKLKFSTGLRSFALLVTAEPYYQVARPSELVVFQNGRSPKPPVQTDTIEFSAFSPAPKYGLDTLANVRYDGETPLDLLQAQKVFEIAGRLGADRYAPDVYQEASIGLRQAETVVQTRARRGAQEYARRSVASSNEAIKITLRKLEAEELERQIAERREEMANLERQAAEAERRAEEFLRQKEEAEESIAQAERELARIESEKTSLQSALQRLRAEQSELRAAMGRLQSDLGELRSEKLRLQADRERLQEEKARLSEDKATLEERLQGALSQVAETRSSARGLILSLPDILFDLDKATLKSEARVALAKLAGILLIMPDLNLRIEGHTDSTGTDSYNLRLSQQRSDSVFDFLAQQGVAGRRMTAVGYGEDRPIEDNSTAAGRSRNRRVEIVIAEGTVAEETR